MEKQALNDLKNLSSRWEEDPFEDVNLKSLSNNILSMSSDKINAIFLSGNSHFKQFASEGSNDQVDSRKHSSFSAHSILRQGNKVKSSQTPSLYDFGISPTDHFKQPSNFYSKTAYGTQNYSNKSTILFPNELSRLQYDSENSFNRTKPSGDCSSSDISSATSSLSDASQTKRKPRAQLPPKRESIKSLWLIKSKQYSGGLLDWNSDTSKSNPQNENQLNSFAKQSNHFEVTFLNTRQQNPQSDIENEKLKVQTLKGEIDPIYQQKLNAQLSRDEKIPPQVLLSGLLNAQSRRMNELYEKSNQQGPLTLKIRNPLLIIEDNIQSNITISKNISLKQNMIPLSIKGSLGETLSKNPNILSIQDQKQIKQLSCQINPNNLENRAPNTNKFPTINSTSTRLENGTIDFQNYQPSPIYISKPETNDRPNMGFRRKQSNNFKALIDGNISPRQIQKNPKPINKKSSENQIIGHSFQEVLLPKSAQSNSFQINGCDNRNFQKSSMVVDNCNLSINSPYNVSSNLKTLESDAPLDLQKKTSRNSTRSHQISTDIRPYQSIEDISFSQNCQEQQDRLPNSNKFAKNKTQNSSEMALLSSKLSKQYSQFSSQPI